MPERQETPEPDFIPRLAAIDIGTNSVRFLVAEPRENGDYQILDEERESTRLGRGLQETGCLREESVEASLAALGRFKQIAEGHKVSRIRTIATCAVREAKNGPQFCQRAKDELGLEIEIISAEKEAHLAFFSVRRHFDLTGRNVALADIGGGSTEIVFASGNMIEVIYTTQLGAVRMSEIYGCGSSMAGDDYDRMIAGIDRRLKKQTKKPILSPHLLIGSGGTFTSLAEMIMAQKGQEGLPVRGYQVSRAELRHLLESLRKMPPKARRDVAGLNPDRADIIVAGLAIVDRIMRRLKVNMLQAHNRGVRDGLMLSMIEKEVGAQSQAVDRDSAIDRLATACGADLEHGNHVARLALQIHEHLTQSDRVDQADGPLLEAAARLQDVGYLINYDRHHKHSYHLILNSRLRGFRPHELEIIANVARYHRGAEPKKKHANFRQLSSEDRLRVRKLAAILRLADGLDRSHGQLVEKIDLALGKDEMEICVRSDDYPEVDIWGVRRRAGLFEKIFKTSLRVTWKATDDSPESRGAENGPDR